VSAEGLELTPFIVFATADPTAAVPAFDLEAVDPPIRAAAGPGRRWRERFVVIHGCRRLPEPVSAVTRIDADDNYVILHVPGARHLVRQSLRALERELDPARWVRVHRSVIVRRDEIREVVTRPHGDRELRLADGTTVRVGAAYRTRLHIS